MSLGEFALIDRFFSRNLPARDDVLVGIGDDGAVLRIGASQRLVTTLAVAGTAARDAAGGDAARLGDAVMAAALNRLAAVGARPAWATLALTLPEADERWLAAFSDALFAVAAPWRVALVGGDTTRGPLAVTVVGHGLLDEATARVAPATGIGDGIYVSGALGAGMVAARTLPSTIHVALGGWIRASGGAAADLSEGLGAALAHLLARAGLGTRLDLSTLPLAPGVRGHLDETGTWPALASHRGDTELCFTLPAAADAQLLARAAEAHIPVLRVATVDDSGSVALTGADGGPLSSPVGRPRTTPS
jgi:thiamine-monophosphate kinase